VYHLLRELGQRVVVIERDERAQFLEDVRRDGAPLLLGDARREAFLADAGITRARSIVLATDNDIANLEVALDARRLNPTIRVVLRLFDPNMAEKVREGF
jgi:voltage-gated potassium channel Kch